MADGSPEKIDSPHEPNVDDQIQTPRPVPAHKTPEKAKIDVKHVILVLSGKGGVGKSTVAVNLAYAFSALGKQTGLLDLDIHGPNVPKMLGLEEYQLLGDGQMLVPVRMTGTLQVISMAFLLEKKSDPVVWRGAIKMGVIRQFLSDVRWGSLDYLIVDLPPGTGDEALTIAQIAPNIRGAVIVTTPQDVATLDSTKAITFVGMLEIPVLGVIENMSGLTCPHCHGTIDLFGSGGGERIAQEHHVPFLGKIPLDIKMREAGDSGHPFIGKKQDSPTWRAIDEVMDRLMAEIEKSD
ncbi:Mrp/NBP35 family ATP-binding protein [Methanospirillum lacunae]|uniref:Iron-sulfur cluster carrier protein n=1 Tax=Methanospirillum lacunae TaxID=668570 RepID=A0A2V2MXD1_9EURY|nr:Mrp/NBP35 family ATP-binding protein [Methanospirillum lacunae]PWR70890.1 ATP-binding protein [Methanospirillum lacunae]